MSNQFQNPNNPSLILPLDKGRKGRVGLLHFGFKKFGFVWDLGFRIFDFRHPLRLASSEASRRLGFSLVEVILAVALFGLFATALIGLLMNSYGSNLQAAEKDKANFYAQQGLEAVWSIRRQAWNFLVNGDHGVNTNAGYWQFIGTSDLLDDRYTRVVNVNNICRNASSQIIDCSAPGAIIDLHTKKVSSKVTYSAVTGVNNEIELISYLTTWQSKDWIQTDWSGGSGQINWSNPTRYFTDDGNIDYLVNGEVKLKNLGGGCGTKIWPFDVPADYTYDPAKIEVIGGFAQLVAQSGFIVNGQSINAGFDTSLTPWIFGSWGTITPTGSWQSSGGNPGGYARIQFPTSKNRISGGYFQQSFTVTAQTINSATLNLDWIVSQYSGAADSLVLYAFVDPAAGAPALGQEVWNSGNQTATTPWTSVANINVASKITGPGTYYLKIAAYVDYPGSNRQYAVGFDNVLLTWSGTTSASYPTDRPMIDPVNFYTAAGIERWSSFTETAQKNGGEIYYQLNADDGAGWRYWNGSNWVIASVNDYNTAAVINSNLGDFPTTTAKIKFKAFLASDGSQSVRLDQVNVGWGQQTGVSGYAISGWLESSAFNTGSQSSLNLISWDEETANCAPACDIKIQIRTAPNSGGVPGIWTPWFGLAGAGTYFTSPLEQLLSADLNFNQWVQYRAELSGDGSATPALKEIKINYTP